MINKYFGVGVVVRKTHVRTISDNEKYDYFVLLIADTIGNRDFNNFIDFRIASFVPKEIVSQIKDGKIIGVRGKIINEEYSGKNGLKFKRLVVLAENITIFDFDGKRVSFK